MDLETIRKTAIANLESAEAELQDLQQRVSDLRTIVQGLDLAEKFYAATESAGSSPINARTASAIMADVGFEVSAPPTAGKTDVAQSDLCLMALKEFGVPATSGQIREYLSHYGHEFSAEQVRGAMAYLHRKERVIRTSPGVWTLREPTQEGHDGVNGQFTLDRN